MAGVLGPRTPVVPPQADTRDRVGSLLGTFRPLEDQPVLIDGREQAPRWAFGFEFEPENCGTAGRRGVTCGADAAKTIGANRDIVTADPFVVWAGDKCSAFDNNRDRRARAERQLLASRGYQIAAELWTGDVATDDGLDNRFLASPEADTLNDPVLSGADAAYSVVNALGCLEYALGKCSHGGRGVIHCTMQLATAWAERGMLRREGAQLLTYLDTFVVCDAGYPGTGPEGQAEADETQWAYATGIPQVRIDPQIAHYPNDQTALGLAEGLKRDTNDIEYRAEQRAAVTWDGCCHLAVNVDLPLCFIGGAS